MMNANLDDTKKKLAKLSTINLSTVFTGTEN
jgi:hypothetical protein